MHLLSRKAKAAGFVLAVFSACLSAQEMVSPGNSRTPYQPPSWFAKMANPETVYAKEIDFYVGIESPRSSYGRPTSGSGIKYFCGLEKTQDGGIKWYFCDM